MMQDRKENTTENNSASQQAPATRQPGLENAGEQEQTAGEQDAALEQQRKEAMTERD